MTLRSLSVIRSIGTVTGTLLAGPTGAFVGTLVAGLLPAGLSRFGPLIEELLSGLSADVIAQTSTRLSGRLPPSEKQQINHDLQTAFRDACREALYDLGGAPCFPTPWQDEARDVPQDLVFPRTATGRRLWHEKSPLADQVCDVLRDLEQAIVAERLLPLLPPVDQPAASVYPYLNRETPQAINQHFFEQIFAPFLAGYGALLTEVPDLAAHLRRHLLDRTLVHLGELLKARPKTWRAFNRLLLEQLRTELDAGKRAQARHGEQLDTLLAEFEAAQLSRWSDGMADLLAATGRLEKRVDEGFTALLSRMGEQHGEVLTRFEDLQATTQRVARKVDFVAEEVGRLRRLLEAQGQVTASAIEPPARNWSALRRYLPEALFHRLESAPDAERESLAFGPLRMLLEAVVSFLPQPAAQTLLAVPASAAEEERGKQLEGTFLLVEVSADDHAVSAPAATAAEQDPEILAQTIDHNLDAMVDSLFRHGGVLLSLSGQELTGFFPGVDQAALRAVAAAWAIRDAVSGAPAPEKQAPSVALQVRAGCSTGTGLSVLVNDDTAAAHLLTGSSLIRAARARAAAGAGEIIVDQDTQERLGAEVKAEPLTGHSKFCRIVDRPETVDLAPHDPWHEVEAWISDPARTLWELVDRLDLAIHFLPAGLLSQLVDDPHPERLTGQHRQVTALCIDLEGLNELVEFHGAHDVEGSTRAIAEYVRTLQDEVNYYGGRMHEIVGSGRGNRLLVLFGAPVAHEQDAHRAALSALGVQRMLSRLSSPLAGSLLVQRIGIHSSSVFADSIGAARHHQHTYAVFGAAPRLARWLAVNSGAGEVWVSPAVWEQIAGDFAAEAVETVAEADVEPLLARRLLAHRRDEKRTAHALRSELVGRERELARLQALVEDVQFGEDRQVAAVVGEGGVGKSRLVAEWRKRVEASRESAARVRWLLGAGRAYGQRTRGVLIAIVEQLLEIEDGDTQRERWNRLIRGLRKADQGAQTGEAETFLNRMAYLGHFLDLDLSLQAGLAGRIAALDEQTLHLQTRPILVDLLTAAARVHPLVLLLEDLHWADEASLELLRYLMEQLGDVPIIFCLVFRPNKDRPVWRAWQEIVTDLPYCVEIELLPLNDKGTAALSQNLLETAEPLPDALVTRIRQETNGNPLYVEEVLQRLIEENALVQQEDGWRFAATLQRLTIPDTLYRIIQSRIDDLDAASPGARRLLWLASVLGTSFTREGLAHLFTAIGRERDEFRLHLNALGNAAPLERTRVGLGETEHPGFAFKHGLVQQVAYENMPMSLRRRYHRQVGQWLEAQFQENLTPYYDELAFHFDRGSRWDKALEFHWRAGERDAGAYANVSAAAHLDSALRVAEQLTLSQEALGQLHLARGRVAVTRGDYDTALDHLEQAVELFDESKEATRLLKARTCYEAGRVHERLTQDLDAGFRWRNRGLAVVADGPPSAEAAMLHALGGMLELHRGNLVGILEEGAAALALAEAVGAGGTLVLAHRLLSIAHRALGQYEQARAYCQRSIDLCEAQGDLLGLGKDLTNLGVIAFEMDEWAEARQAYERALPLLERVGEQFTLARATANLADLCAHLGEFTRGLELAQKAVSIAEELDVVQQIVNAHVVVATLHWRQDELAAAQGELRKAAELVGAAPGYRPTVDRWLAQVSFSQGNPGRAHALIEAWLGQDQKILADEREPIHGLFAQVVAAQGELEQGITIASESLARAQEAGMRYQTARAQLVLAHLLAEDEGSHAEALRLTREAETTFTGLGAVPDRRNAFALFRRLGEVDE